MILVLMGVCHANADVYTLKTLDLGAGYTISGSVTTDGTMGALSAGNFTDWNVVVIQTNQWSFSPSNSEIFGFSSVSTDGSALSVANPDGSLIFGGMKGGDFNGVLLADFTNNAIFPGGQAGLITASLYQSIAPLAGDPTAPAYAMAFASAADAHVFNLRSLDLGNGFLMTGTITTDGRLGELSSSDVTGWNITVTETTQDIFDHGNSTILGSGLSTSPGGQGIVVANPDGYWWVSKGLFPEPYLVQLADFQQPEFSPGGQAGSISPFAYQVISPLVSPADSPLYLATATPEPSSLVVVLGVAGGAGALGLARRLRRLWYG